MLSAFAASGLLALPVTSTPLFVAHEDPLLELPSDCPTAVSSHPSHLASLQHLFIQGFLAEYEVEEAHKEALAIAEEPWARIFNHNHRVVGRAQNPPDRKMVWVSRRTCPNIQMGRNTSNCGTCRASRPW